MLTYPKKINHTNKCLDHTSKYLNENNEIVKYEVLKYEVFFLTQKYRLDKYLSKAIHA